jgi:hypothetical protein
LGGEVVVQMHGIGSVLGSLLRKGAKKLAGFLGVRVKELWDGVAVENHVAIVGWELMGLGKGESEKAVTNFVCVSAARKLWEEFVYIAGARVGLGWGFSDDRSYCGFGSGYTQLYSEGSGYKSRVISVICSEELLSYGISLVLI